MGQTLSKDHFSLTFAYVDPSSFLPNSPFAKSKLDLRPKSALGTISSSHSRPLQPRHDSGFDDSHCDSKDLEDLAYIDAAHYSDLSSLAAPPLQSSGDQYEDEDESHYYRPRRRSLPVSLLFDFSHQALDDGDCDPSWGHIRLGDISDPCQIDLTRRFVRRISANIRYIFPLISLILADNFLTTLPPQIGALINLTNLDLSYNLITILPDELYALPKLTDLNLSHNQLTSLPSSIGGLSKVTSFILDHNQLTELPQEIGHLKSLTTLDVSFNPLCYFPAELSRLPLLRRLRFEACPMVPEFHHNLHHNAPSLFETCARLIVRQNISLPCDLRQDIRDYLNSAKTCSFCGGPFFRSCIRRGRVVQRAEDVYLPLVYLLCSQHWNDESERVRFMFSGPAITSPPQVSALTTNLSLPSQSPPTSSSSSNDVTAAPAPSSPELRRPVSRSKIVSRCVHRLSATFFPSRPSDGPADETVTAFTASSTNLATNVEMGAAGKFSETRIGRRGGVEAGPVET